jgi:hypothetical protein
VSLPDPDLLDGFDVDETELADAGLDFGNSGKSLINNVAIEA